MKRYIYYLKRFIFTSIAKKNITSHGNALNVNFLSKFNNNTFLGDNCNFNGFNVSGKGKITIGNNFHSGKDIKLITQNHNYKGEKIPYDDSYIIKDITIGDNVWIGSHVIILGGVHIKEGAIIQAGSVVVNDIDYCGIAGGSPAKVFAYRDKIKYEELKRKGRFH
ncbi:acyltransferase [Macrococcoides canis]|uniref:acyltransferase n=1 Tax=Macrococcoides canis TaxID=1855823 RepID=UPI0020B8B90F|nr:acyltransferase [Macrococcus canis]UTH00861.1 acyltransferase [Macrococcus canis]UTH03225.1 acyltransferase [Macrococcus canis]